MSVGASTLCLLCARRFRLAPHHFIPAKQRHPREEKVIPAKAGIQRQKKVAFLPISTYNETSLFLEVFMGVTVKLSDDLIEEARHHGSVLKRSIPKQIEYWSRIGKIAEENPDLPYSFIKDILLAKKEVGEKKLKPYKFS